MALQLVGPMTGLPNFNYDDFCMYAHRLRDAGYEVINPAENFNGRQDLKHEEYLKRTIMQIASSNCTGLAIIERLYYADGDSSASPISFATSQGSRAEITHYVYCALLGAKKLENIKTADEWLKISNTDNCSILDEAKSIVCGDRKASYGRPLENLALTASLWSPVLKTMVTPEQVALCMIQLKIARECHAPKRDNWVDIAGYAHCGSLCG